MDLSYDNSVRPQDGDKGGLGTGSSRGGVGSGTIRGDVNPGMGRGDVNPGMVRGDVNPGMVRGDVNPGMVRGDVNSGAISGDVNSGAGLDANAGVANVSGINVGVDTRANMVGNSGVDFSANLNNNTNVNNGGFGNGGFGNGNGVDANANNNGFGSGNNNINANNNGFGNGNNANNIGFGNENNVNVSVNDANDSVNNIDVSVNNDGFSDEDSQVQGDNFYTDFKQSVDALSTNDGDIILGGKKKKKWLIFGVIGGIVAVVGVVALVLAIMLTSEPKSGTGIKAKNYEEAFNIYANYFLFGERSKQAVNWDATDNEGFKSYFRKAVDSFYEIESIKSGEETVGDVIAKMNTDYEVFWGMFVNQEDQTDAMVNMVETYGRKLRFLNKYYNVGIPEKTSVLENYLEAGYDGAEKYVFDVAAEYENVGSLYGNNVSELVGDFGYNQLSVIEIYSNLGCVNGNSIDYECVLGAGDVGDVEYSRKIAEEYSEYFSIVYNTRSNAEVDVYEINDSIVSLQTKKGDL